MRSFLCALCFVFLTASSSLAQSPFQNLDFETFVPPTGPEFERYSYVEFPGWGELQTAAHVGASPLKYVRNRLFDEYFNDYTEGHIIAGNASLVLAAGEVGFIDPELNFFSASSISQTGLIPPGTRSIRLLASSPYGEINPDTGEAQFQTPLWSLLIGADELDIIDLGDGGFLAPGAEPKGFGVNIDSTFAGTEQTLTIRANRGFTVDEKASFDNITFSATAVPEPSGLEIVSLAVLGLGLRRRR